MTTVNTVSTKVDGSWVPLIPDATTSSKGVVQVGNGLSVNDGIISLYSINIPSASLTNNNGFAIGRMKSTFNSYSASSSAQIFSNKEITLGTYTPIVTSVWERYPPFDCDNIQDSPIVIYGNGGQKYTTQIQFKALRESDESIIGSNTFDGSGTLTITLPIDWDYDVDKVTIIARNPSSTAVKEPYFTITSSSSYVEYYFNPVVGDNI